MVSIYIKYGHTTHYVFFITKEWIHDDAVGDHPCDRECCIVI